MKNRTLIALFSLAVLSLFAVGAQAQHAQHHPSEQNSGPGMMGEGMMGQGMMSQAAMGHRMMAHHQEMRKLMGQLMQNMTAMENEKDPAALQKLMAEHRTLLEQMHGEMMQQGKVMSDFMKNCPAVGTSQKPTSK
jgi:hemerythrin-like domain-containing protein